MSTTTGNGRAWAALTSASAGTLMALVTYLGSAPWWLTAMLFGSFTLIAITYMITSAWGERPPSVDFAAWLAATRGDSQLIHQSLPPPSMIAAERLPKNSAPYSYTTDERKDFSP